MSSWKVLKQKKSLLTFFVDTWDSILFPLYWPVLLPSVKVVPGERATSHSISLCCLIRNELVRFLCNREECRGEEDTWRLPGKSHPGTQDSTWQNTWLRAVLELDLYTKSAWLQSDAVTFPAVTAHTLGAKVEYWPKFVPRGRLLVFRDLKVI